MNQWPNEEQLVAQLHDWLSETRDQAFSDTAPPSPPVERAGDVGVYQLAEELTALRHEIKLQTKSSRKLQNANQEVLDAVAQLAETLPAQPSASDSSARQLVEALVDLDEALERGRAAMEASRRQLVESSASQMRGIYEHLDQLFDQLPWWRKWLCRSWWAAAREICLPTAMQQQQNVLAALLEGYTLLQRRFAKSLEATRIRRIDCVGKAVDPQLMNVVEVIDDSYYPPGEVIEMLRPGYTWHGKVFHCAEVKAVRT